MLIAKITESDFFGGEPQYIDDDARYNTRGVMTDGEGNIAMMKIEDSKYYKLPGGSIEITETPDKAFLREVTEETGYPAELLGYLGWRSISSRENSAWFHTAMWQRKYQTSAILRCLNVRRKDWDIK